MPRLYPTACQRRGTTSHKAKGERLRETQYLSDALVRGVRWRQSTLGGRE
jgi:hypothetical protein